MFFPHIKLPRWRSVTRRHVFSSLLATSGYILSPLSWWNDFFVNIPLAYAFSFPFTLVDEQLFLPSFVFGYWLSNLLGFVLLHRGISGLVTRRLPSQIWKQYVIITLLYTVVIMFLVGWQWLPSPIELIDKN